MNKRVITTKHAIFALIIAGGPIIAGTGCKVSYSFTGASISADVKTISVQFFPNRANLSGGIIRAGFDQEFTDALKDKFKAQTNLEFVNDIGDVNFEGEIVGYKTSPMAITGNETAALNRFTVSVRVKFTNAFQSDLNYESVFTRYEDYESSRDLSEVEDELLESILEQITEDVFNKAFVNW
ncbi:MAG: LptE family protein [Bacteroidales bacterium]|nr:MAG: LptE family protein [Bacteroidales bacterium]